MFENEKLRNKNVDLSENATVNLMKYSVIEE